MGKTMKFMRQQINSQMKQNTELQRKLRRLSADEFVAKFGRDVYERQLKISVNEDRMRRREEELRSKAVNANNNTSENPILQVAMQFGLTPDMKE